MTQAALSPELKKHFKDYVEQVFRTYGAVNAPKEEKIRILKMIRDQEIKRGLTITPDGQQVYLTESNVTGGDGTVDRVETGSGKKGFFALLSSNPQLALWGGLVVVALLAVIILPGFLFNKKGTAAVKTTETPTVVAVAEATAIPANYSVLIGSYNGDVRSTYDAPNSMSYNNQIFMVKTSARKLVSISGSAWCEFDEEAPPNTGCWLEDSTLNIVIGMEDRSYTSYFSGAKEGDSIVVTSGSRKVEYQLQPAADVQFNDTSIFVQNQPKLTLVFFGARDKDGNLTVTEKRHVIQAFPVQESLELPATASNQATVPLQTFTAPLSAFKIDQSEFDMTVRTYKVDGGTTGYLRVVVHLAPKGGSTSPLVQWAYAMDINNTHYVPFQSISKENGQDIVFITPWTGDQAVPFTLFASKGTKQSKISGSLIPPQPLAYLTINDDEISATYEHGQLSVQIGYIQESDTAETCQECVLAINGKYAYPLSPVIFNPTNGKEGGVTMDFRVDVVAGNMNGLEIVVGNRTYALVPAAAPTPAP